MELEELLQTLPGLERNQERASAVVVAAYLSQELENLLRQFFVDDRAVADKLLSGLGPLASFSACLETAFAAGLISEREHKNLDLIRKIRNSFAHNPDERLSFEAPEIRSRCLELEVPQAVGDIFFSDGKVFSTDQPRERFIVTSFYLLLVLIVRREQATHRLKPDSISEETLRALIPAKSDS